MISKIVVATAYCTCTICCGPHAKGRTKTGHKARGNIVAVDPKVIPLHSTVRIRGTTYKALDTGGKIKGSRVDILMPTHKQAKAFGRQRVRVQVEENRTRRS